MVGGYLIAFAVLVITGSRLGQTCGYKRLFLLGIGVFALASLGCGLAPSPAVLVVMRVVQGMGAGVPAFGSFLAAQRRATATGRTPLIDTRVLSRPAIALGLVTLLITTATYYALLFTLAQYFQHGLGRSPLASGLVLVPWVAAFGIAGQLTRRLPARFGPNLPVAGCLLLAGAYLAIGLSPGDGRAGDVGLVVLLAAGGLGLGVQFATVLGHLANSVPARYAADISGASTTTLQIGGACGVAGFGSLYLALAAQPGPAVAAHGFAGTTLVLGVTAMVAAVTAYLTTHVRAVVDAGEPAAAETGAARDTR